MHARYLMSAAAVFACVLSSTGAGAATLYERLGGYDAIQAVVDQTITNVAADHRINKFFAHADIPRLRRALADQICSATGGGCYYWGKDMKTTHAGMHIHSRHFNALVHGLCSLAPVLPGEDPAEFELMLNQWMKEMDPGNPEERRMVYDMCCAARAADRVFARSWLAQELEREGMPYEPFETLDDIASALP